MLLLFLALLTAGPQPAPENGRDVVQLMHEQYADSWYGALAFTQRTLFYRGPDQPPTEQFWHETMAIPGGLHIRYGSTDSGNATLFARDKQYTFREGELAKETPLVHPLLVLGFDVYRQAPETTLSQLESLGFNLDLLYETTFNGRAVYVVGARRGDETATQFWVDKELLVFVRMIRVEKGKNQVQDFVFADYQPFGGAWIAPTVLFYVDGQLVMREEYQDLRVPESVDARLFDPATAMDGTWPEGT